MLRYCWAWLCLMFAAIMNGFMREAWMKPALGDLSAHQLSTLTLLVLIAALVASMHRVWPFASTKVAWRVGIMWLLMTLAFEFLFGHYVAGHAWAKLFTDYNILAGRVWPLVPLWTLCAPAVIHRLQTRPKTLPPLQHSHGMGHLL